MIVKGVSKRSIPFYVMGLMLAFIFHGFPRYGVMFPSSVYAIIIIALTVFLFRSITSNDVKLLISLFLVLILELLIDSFAKSSYVISQDISGLLQKMIPVLMAMVLVRKRDICSAKIILGFYFMRILITMITTIIGLQTFLGASRDLGNGAFIAENPLYPVYLSLNIGGFDLAYTIVLLIPFFCYLYKYSHDYRYSYALKLILVFLIVFSEYCILQMEYTTAFLLSILALTSLFTTKRTNISNYITFLFLLALVFCFSNDILAQLLKHMSETFDSEEFSARFYDLSRSLTGQTTSDISDVDARQEAYSKSFNAIMANPLGTWFSQTKVGGHSFILDYIAKYGFVGLGLIVYLLYVVYSSMLKPYIGKPIYPFLVLDYLLFIATAILNPHLYLSFVAFVIPLFYFVSNQYARTKNAPSV